MPNYNMTTKILLSTLFIIAILTSCNDGKRHADNSSPFAHFISNMDRVKLPLHYDLIAQDIENAKKPILADTQFIQEQDYIIGLLPDTIDNYKVLYLSTGDDFYPSLKVFSKTGKTLSDNLICFPECAAGDPEIDSCSSSVDIYSDSIFARLRYLPFTLDSSSNKIYDYFSEERRGKTFKVNKTGGLDTRERWVRK